MGLWLVQECRRAWERGGKTFTYEELMRLAEAAPPFASVVNPDDSTFILPSSMPAAIADFCRKTGQPVPVEPGAVVRCRAGEPGPALSLGAGAAGGTGRPAA